MGLKEATSVTTDQGSRVITPRTLTSPHHIGGYRYGGTEGESVTIFTNDTKFGQIDGFELRLGGPSEVTVTFYEDVIDNQPYSLVSSETFMLGSEAERGEWHRAYLQNPVVFPRGSEIAFSTRIRRTDGEELVVMQRRFFRYRRFTVRSKVCGELLAT